jgi:hypothetical protein
VVWVVTLLSMMIGSGVSTGLPPARAKHADRDRIIEDAKRVRFMWLNSLFVAEALHICQEK